MTIPGWSPIADNEVDAESPVTQSLMQRLRNQWAAYFGVDPTAATPPSFTLPASLIKIQEQTRIDTSVGASTNGTTPEFLVCHLADALESGRFTHINNAGVLDTSITVTENAGPTTKTIFLDACEVHYSAGIVDGVTLRYWHSDINAMTSFFVPFNNTYQLLLRNGVFGFQCDVNVKCRATASDLYLQFQGVNLLGSCRIRTVFTRSAFAARG